MAAMGWETAMPGTQNSKVPDMFSNRSTTLGGATLRGARILGNASLIVAMLTAAAFLLPSLLAYQRYVITGGSMSGTFERGSVAFEKTVPVDDLEVGDVVTYLPPADTGVTTLVTHRIVKKRHASDGSLVFRTKGDANDHVDPWTFQLYAAVQPRVEFTVPTIGYLFLGLADRDVRVVVVGIPAGLIALYSLVEVLRALRPRRAEAGLPATNHQAPRPLEA